MCGVGRWNPRHVLLLEAPEGKKGKNLPPKCQSLPMATWHGGGRRDLEVCGEGGSGSLGRSAQGLLLGMTRPLCRVRV
jgi:hypothetical protein